MVLDVLMYADTANPDGYPPAWPAEVKELPDESPLPEAPWQRMTVEEYEAYRSEPLLATAAASVARRVKAQVRV